VENPHFFAILTNKVLLEALKRGLSLDPGDES